eukprot:12607982-Alexandrium_andersonii.AAC.1
MGRLSPSSCLNTGRPWIPAVSWAISRLRVQPTYGRRSFLPDMREKEKPVSYTHLRAHETSAHL